MILICRDGTIITVIDNTVVERERLCDPELAMWVYRYKEIMESQI